MYYHISLSVLLQVSALEEDITQVRSDLITKDDQLRELTQQAASEDQAAAAAAAAEVKKLKGEKNSLQAQLECKSRQLKVSLHLSRLSTVRLIHEVVSVWRRLHLVVAASLG